MSNDEILLRNTSDKPISVEVVRLSKPRKTQLIDRTHVKAFLLDQAKRERAHKFTQVSELTLATANEILRQWLINYVRRLPSKGVRI